MFEPNPIIFSVLDWSWLTFAPYPFKMFVLDSISSLKVLISLILLPYNLLQAAAKKIINPELTDEQKDIQRNKSRN